jgi:hypothetical protein
MMRYRKIGKLKVQRVGEDGIGNSWQPVASRGRERKEEKKRAPKSEGVCAAEA